MTNSVTMEDNPLFLSIDPAESPVPSCDLIGGMMDDGVTGLRMETNEVIFGQIFARYM